jgi:hypothetical protein
MFQIYTAIRIVCSHPRLSETHRIITVLRDSTTCLCKWIQSVGSQYVPELYFTSDGLFPSLPLWNPKFHYGAQRLNHWNYQMISVSKLTLCSGFKKLFRCSVLFLASEKPTGSLLCSQIQPPDFVNESGLYAHTLFQIYTSLRMVCSLPRLCQNHRTIIVLTETTTGPCKWIQSVGSHYLPDVYFASDDLFLSSPLWNPQDYYCAHSQNYRYLHMDPDCRLTLCSRSILRFGWSFHFLAFVKPKGSIWVLTDPTTGPCKWIHSVGSHYVPDVYFASDCLFPSSPL